MENIVKKTATAIVLILCLMFIVRCCMAADKSVFSALTPTDSLCCAWHNGDADVKTVKVEREIADDGYFAAYAFYYCPASGEVQFAVRWNESVYEYTDMEPGHEFSFHLLNETTGETYPAVCLDEDSRAMYSYRKLAAYGVSCADDEQLTAVMELRDGYESTQVLKFAEQPYQEYKIPRKIRKQLENSPVIE